MIYFDSETCGFTGPMVLLQYAQDDGPIQIHHVWNEPIKKTLSLLEWLCSDDLCAFNIGFDWFHVVKLYNVLRVFYDNGYTGLPYPNSFAQIEEQNPSQYCLKPQNPIDLMLVARKGKYQHLMKRRPIYIRKVPTAVAYELIAELEHLEFPEGCFIKGKPEWKVNEHKDNQGKVDPTLVNLQLDFKPSTSLNALAEIILGENKADWPIPDSIKPTELEWWPYGQHGDRPWLKVIDRWITMWEQPQALYYAERDVDLTRRLHLEGFSDAEPNDTDSVLACAIAAARWRGYHINKDKVRSLKEKYIPDTRLAPTAPSAVSRVLETKLSAAEKLIVQDTSEATLESLERNSSPEVAEFCTNVLTARRAKNRVTLLDKLLQANNYHPNFKVIGTKSNRQSGGADEGDSKTGSINPQGIPQGEIRDCFEMAYPGEKVFGGDAVSYEITILDAVFPDPNLHQELSSGKKFHAVMGEIWYNLSYDDMMHRDNKDKYNKTKGADFAYIYGAQESKLADVLGQTEDQVSESMSRFQSRFPGVYEERERRALQFCSMRQPGGIGTKVEWHEPEDYAESILGFRRYFTIENNVCRFLFKLANKLPDSISKNPDLKKTRVVRNPERGAQTIVGAVQSALYAAAFNIQASNMRAACNHYIQSPGGEICKEFQRALWDEQPVGVSNFRIRVYNVHDELLSVTDGTVDTFAVRDKVINYYRQYIPLLQWEWAEMNSWGDK